MLRRHKRFAAGWEGSYEPTDPTRNVAARGRSAKFTTPDSIAVALAGAMLWSIHRLEKMDFLIIEN